LAFHRTPVSAHILAKTAAKYEQSTGEGCAIRSFIAAGISALVIFGMFWASPRRSTPPRTVQVTRPEVSDITDSVTVRGQVAELRHADLFADGLSVVESLHVGEGQRVGKDTLLMTLRRTDDAQLRSQARYADLETAAQTLIAAEPEQWESVLQAMAQEQLQPEDSGARRYGLYSPMAGTVMKVAVKAGDSVSSVFPCIEISDLTALCIRAQADENAVKKLAVGQKCAVSVPALTETKLAGHVRSVSPYAQQTASLLGSGARETEVEIALDGENTALRPGYSATARVTTDSCRNAVLVPFDAIAQDADNREYVMVLRGGRARKQTVVVRYELEDSADVTAGVAPDDLLILNPGALRDGERVCADAAS